jgi:hypothetical protein
VRKCSDKENVLTCLRDHDEWVPCHNGVTRPQVADGGDGLQVWRVAANILNKPVEDSRQRVVLKLGG